MTDHQTLAQDAAALAQLIRVERHDIALVLGSDRLPAVAALDGTTAETTRTTCPSVHVAALWPQEGQSVGDLLGGQFPDWMTVREDGGVQVTGEDDAVHHAFCHDVDRDRFLADVYPRYVLTSCPARVPLARPDPLHASSHVRCEQEGVAARGPAGNGERC